MALSPLLKKLLGKKSYQSGLTLIEILIVVSILAILILILILSMRPQLARSRDAKRKSDLQKVKTAFENYYNDNGCYPPDTILDECGGSQLAPYLSEIPCDPLNKTNYVYMPLQGNTCGGYRLFTQLERAAEDQSVKDLGCTASCGCGFGVENNYGVSAGIPVSDGTCAEDETGGGPQPSTGPVLPSPSGNPQTNYACDTKGFCNIWDPSKPELQTCQRWTDANECDTRCYEGSPWACQGYNQIN